MRNVLFKLYERLLKFLLKTNYSNTSRFSFQKHTEYIFYLPTLTKKYWLKFNIFFISEALMKLNVTSYIGAKGNCSQDHF